MSGCDGFAVSSGFFLMLLLPDVFNLAEFLLNLCQMIIRWPVILVNYKASVN